MKISIKTLSAIIFTFSSISYAQETQIYKHPSLNFQFSASQQWIDIYHSEDSLIYEMMSSDSILQVMLWYTETEQNAKKYLAKMADMKSLSVTEKEPSSGIINNKEIWMYTASGHAGQIQIQTLLAVIPHGNSEIHPKENRLFIIQIWCQKGQYLSKKNTFEEILNSVQIEEK